MPSPVIHTGLGNFIQPLKFFRSLPTTKLHRSESVTASGKEFQTISKLFPKAADKESDCLTNSGPDTGT